MNFIIRHKCAQVYLSSSLLLVLHISAIASEIIYTPLNPSFGGNPNNGVVLLSSASATNRHKDPNALSASSLQKTPLQTFNETLERAILGQLASSVSQKLLGNGTGKLTPGTVDTTNFTIRISDLGGGVLQVTTTDKFTGFSTAFQVGQ